MVCGLGNAQMPRKTKEKPLTISGSYESYCRERKASRSRIQLGANPVTDGDELDHPLIEIQSRDEDDDSGTRIKKNRRRTPDTVPTAASWSVSSKSIINSWYEPTTSSSTFETTKTISSYASNKDVFSPLYEVTMEHTNVYEQNGLSLPRPGQTPRFGKLAYKCTNTLTPKQADTPKQEARRLPGEVSSRKVREQWQQLQDKSRRLLGPKTPLSAQPSTRTNPPSITTRKFKSSLSESRSSKTFDSYRRGEWKLDAVGRSPDSTLTLDPIVQVPASTSQSTEQNITNVTPRILDGEDRCGGQVASCSSVRVEEPRDEQVGVVFAHRRTLPCSRDEMSQPQNSGPDSTMEEDQSTSDLSIVDVTRFSEQDIGCDRVPLLVERKTQPSATAKGSLSQATREALSTPNLFEKSKSIWSAENNGADDDIETTTSNILIDVTQASHNLDDVNDEGYDPFPGRSAHSDALSNPLTETTQEELLSVYAPSAEQIYQSIVERSIKEKRRLTPKASKAITVSLATEDLKPVVFLSNQFLSFPSTYQHRVAMTSNHTQVGTDHADSGNRSVAEGKMSRRRNEMFPTENHNGALAISENNVGATPPRESGDGRPDRSRLGELELPDLNAICLRDTESDFSSVDIQDDELRAVMQITNGGENASVIFPTFSCDTIPECHSDDGLSNEVSALSHMQEELENTMKVANSVSPRSMPFSLTSPLVFGSSTDSSMADFRDMSTSSTSDVFGSEASNRKSLPFVKKVQFKDEIQELLYVHDIEVAEDTPRSQHPSSCIEGFFSTFDNMIDDFSNVCVACSGGRGKQHGKKRYPTRMEV